MKSERVALGDKYDLAKDRIFVSGSQAVVRLSLMQHARDRAAGLDTAGYVTGYRGFPLDEIAARRASWGLFRDRRPDLYQPILTLNGRIA